MSKARNIADSNLDKLKVDSPTFVVDEVNKSDRRAKKPRSKIRSALVMEIELKLSVDEVNAILQVLGQLPTASNAYPLMMKVKEQAESQVPQEDAPEVVQ